MSEWMQRSPVFQLALMRLRLFLREPGGLFWTFGFPIIVSLILGLAFRSKTPDPIFVAVVEGAGEEKLGPLLAREPSVTATTLPAVRADEALRTGKVSVVVRQEADGTIDYHFDESRPESRLARLVVNDAIQRGTGRSDPTPIHESRVTEPGARYIDFLVPGLLGLGLMSTGLWGIGFSLSEMRTRKLLKRLVATPMRKSDFLFSFLVVRIFALLIEVPSFLAFAHVAFDVRIKGSPVSILLVALVGALTFATIGLLIACRTESSHVVSGVINVISFPMYLCSGVFFSYERFPAAFHPLIRLFPLTLLIQALRSSIIEGESVAALAVPLLTLSAWGAGAFLLALKLFRWK